MHPACFSTSKLICSYPSYSSGHVQNGSTPSKGKNGPDSPAHNDEASFYSTPRDTRCGKDDLDDLK